MKLSERISGFAWLGQILNEALEGKTGRHTEKIEALINRQQSVNPWFTPVNVRMALGAIASNLAEEKLKEWTGRYPELGIEREPMNIGVIMAGNIPLVGFHDILSVLITGNRVIAKTSSKDPELPVAISDLLCELCGEFRSLVEFTEGTIKGFDAVIATGSNNTSRYFEYYFGKYHNLIRKNRNSIAILTGHETDEELEGLGDDIFSYFGLGCRNVSKIFIPEFYDPDNLVQHWERWSDIINHTKYGNNYDYYKAVYIVNRKPFRDHGFCLMKEDTGFASPVSTIYYEYYKRDEDFSFLTGPEREKIQCVAGRGMIPFGQTQWPELWDYADEKDTIEFIFKKNTTDDYKTKNIKLHRLK